MNVADCIKAIGFEDFGACEATLLAPRADVRDMCASGRCQKYNTSWACPPACGDVDEFATFMHSFTTCYVFQTVAELEDEWDWETMQEADALNKQRALELHKLLAQEVPTARVLSSGTCTLCAECTYPDAPCRFPEKKLYSMEACGLMVYEVCALADVPYSHGKDTITYVGCVLV